MPLIVRQGDDMLVRSVHIIDEDPSFKGLAYCNQCSHEFQTEQTPYEEWTAWDFGP